MVQDTMVELLRDMLYISIQLVLPPLAMALIVGLVLGLVMAITSIQEQTLTFVPKILAIAGIFVFLGGWMLTALVDYTRELFVALPLYGGM